MGVGSCSRSGGADWSDASSDCAGRWTVDARGFRTRKAGVDVDRWSMDVRWSTDARAGRSGRWVSFKGPSNSRKSHRRSSSALDRLELLQGALVG